MTITEDRPTTAIPSTQHAIGVRPTEAKIHQLIIKEADDVRAACCCIQALDVDGTQVLASTDSYTAVYTWQDGRQGNVTTLDKVWDHMVTGRGVEALGYWHRDQVFPAIKAATQPNTPMEFQVAKGRPGMVKAYTKGGGWASYNDERGFPLDMPNLRQFLPVRGDMKPSNAAIGPFMMERIGKIARTMGAQHVLPHGNADGGPMKPVIFTMSGASKRDEPILHAMVLQMPVRVP